jgi:hypothetical protein
MTTHHNLQIRGVDRHLWRQVKHAAVERGVPLGLMLNTILADWLASQAEPEPSMLDDYQHRAEQYRRWQAHASAQAGSELP